MGEEVTENDVVVLLFATRITGNSIKYVDVHRAGCQKRIETLIKLATYYIMGNQKTRSMENG